MLQGVEETPFWGQADTPMHAHASHVQFSFVIKEALFILSLQYNFNEQYTLIQCNDIDLCCKDLI